MSDTPATLPASSPPRAGLTAILDAFFEAFCSLRLTVAIILLLGAGSVVGMFVDQTLTFEEHARAWSPTPLKYHLFTFLELHDVFHSWWFTSLMLLLALNLTACSLERLPRIWIDIHNPDPRMTDDKARGLKHLATFTAADPDGFRRAFLSAVGRARGPTVTHEDEGRTTHVFTEKHRYARTGVHVVHLAMLLVMGGSITTTTFGFDGSMGIVEGGTNRVAYGRGPAGLRFRQDLGFSITCTDFRLKRFIDGAPMDYESDLVVVQDGQEVVRKTIQVNDPLEYGGYTFYQSSFQPLPGEERVKLAVGLPGQPKREFVVTPGQRIDVPGTAVAYIPLEVIPSYADLGPALRVQELKPGAPPTSFVVFQNFPDFDEKARRGELALHYKGADQAYMTGLQVARSPAVWVVFLGFLLMFVGMVLAFSMSHRRYWLRMRREEDGRSLVLVAGAARRHLYAFQDEFVALVAALQAVPGARLVAQDQAQAGEPDAGAGHP
jgi:cytochrome c biogenesis protein